VKGPRELQEERELEEMVKWSSNLVTPQQIMEMYNDPCQFFYDEARTP
jgi:hypothetical protein